MGLEGGVHIYSRLGQLWEVQLCINEGRADMCNTGAEHIYVTQKPKLPSPLWHNYCFLSGWFLNFTQQRKKGSLNPQFHSPRISL